MFSNVISSGITLAKVLSGLSKTINIAKEVIPLYESVKPMIRGAKNLPKILNTLNKSSKENETNKKFSTIKTTIESSLINNPTFFK
ncbi:unknown [Mycoplasma sp. CAG:472]|nr:unknown [Mycoplasma sp. CAG:472]